MQVILADAAGRALALLALIIVIGIIGAIVRFIRKRYYMSQMPDEATLTVLLAQLHRMKETGVGYYDRLSYLRSKGYSRVIAEAMLVTAEQNDADLKALAAHTPPPTPPGSQSKQ